MIETFAFDAAKYLEREGAQAELLGDAFASGNADYIKQALRVVAQARGMTAVARDAGVTREALYKALSPKGDPRLSTLLGVAKALDVKLGVELRSAPAD